MSGAQTRVMDVALNFAIGFSYQIKSNYCEARMEGIPSQSPNPPPPPPPPTMLRLTSNLVPISAIDFSCYTEPPDHFINITISCFAFNRGPGAIDSATYSIDENPPSPCSYTSCVLYILYCDIAWPYAYHYPIIIIW